MKSTTTENKGKGPQNNNHRNSEKFMFQMWNKRTLGTCLSYGKTPC